MIDERTEELASLYVLGALNPEEKKVFEAQVQVDAEVRALVGQLRGSIEALAGTSPGIQPPASLKAKLLVDVDDRRRTNVQTLMPRRPWLWLPWALTACFAIVCVVLLTQEGGLRDRSVAQQRRIEELNMMTEALQAESSSLRSTVATLRENTRLADVRIAVLTSLLKNDPKAVAVSLWDGKRQAGVFVVHNLTPPPANKDYQLWIIDPSRQTPVDAGVFPVDAQGNVRIEFKARARIQNANQFAVTQEMKGGSPTPTLNAMVLMGS